MDLQGYEMLIVGSAAGCAAASFYVVSTFLRRAAEMHRQASAEVVVTDTESPLIRAFLPVARGLGSGMRALLAGGRRDSFYGRLHAGMARKLSSAGNPQGINADEYAGLWLICATLGGLCGTLAYVLLLPNPEQAGKPLVPELGIETYFLSGLGLGALYWYGWLNRKRDRYQTSIRKSLPFSLDLLTLSMEAGLDFTSALARIIAKISDTPLGREYAMMLREIQLGKTRTEALRDFARRVDVTDVTSVVASLIQAEELGASLGPILRIQSTQQRERRSQRAEEMAMKAPVKILFPLVVCLFPCVLIVLFGPFLIKFLLNG